jgi:hypothetical protein
MTRTTILLVASLLLAASERAAGADTFGGWQYTPPNGFTPETNPDHVALTKQTSTGFCSLSLFEARRPENSQRAEAAYEWQNIVAHSFTAKVLRRAASTTTDGATYAETTASLVDGSGTRYAGIHYVISSDDAIGSVLVIASSSSTLPACERVATRFVRALTLDWSSPRFTDPEARVQTPEGRWARLGDTNREYTFTAGGTYRFRSESASRLTDESGTYTLRRHQLVLTPRTSATATIRAGIATWSRGKLETSTYTWSKRYIPDTNEWQIILSPRKATARDGRLDDPAGYQYSDSAEPTWKLLADQPSS